MGKRIVRDTYLVKQEIPVLLCFFGLLLFFLLHGSSLPFVGYNAWNFNIYSLIAHNYVQFGYLTTKLAPIISVSQAFPIHPDYYLNHPPLLPLIQSLFFRILGESFFIARLPVILATLGSGVMLFLIGKILYGRIYALIVVMLFTLLPAASIFGKLIGQESLLLFFVLFTVYSILQYEKTNLKRYLGFAFVAAVLGTLTDWPMVYFTFSFSLYLVSRKLWKISLFLFVASMATAMSYLFYVYVLVGSLDFLVKGFQNRSLGSLLEMHTWIALWISTIFFRILLYGNPLIIGSAIILFILLLKKKKERKIFLLCSSLMIFGFLHILLYPEGSFGHPYWIFYATPSVVLLASYFFQKILIKKFALFSTCILLSIIYVFIVENWKTDEIRGNIFRYDLANETATYISPYEKVTVNKTGVIDPEIFEYAFLHPTERVEDISTVELTVGEGIVYSCINRCEKNEDLTTIEKRYDSVRLVGKNLEAIVYYQDNDSKLSRTRKNIEVALPVREPTMLGNIYRVFITKLNAPQI